MSLYARNDEVLRKECHDCWKILLHKAHIGGCYFDIVIFSRVLVVLYFIPCFSEGAQTIKKTTTKMHTMMMSMRGGWVDMVSDLTCILASVCFAYQHNLELCNILLHLLLLDNYASQQCLEKTKTNNKTELFKESLVWSSCFVFLNLVSHQKQKTHVFLIICRTAGHSQEIAISGGCKCSKYLDSRFLVAQKKLLESNLLGFKIRGSKFKV